MIIIITKIIVFFKRRKGEGGYRGKAEAALFSSYHLNISSKKNKVLSKEIALGRNTVLLYNYYYYFFIF